MGLMGGPLGAIIGRNPRGCVNGNVQMNGECGDVGGGTGGEIIRHNRKCRDLGFLVIFIAFWVAMIVNSSFGFNLGNPHRYFMHTFTAQSESSSFCFCLDKF